MNEHGQIFQKHDDAQVINNIVEEMNVWLGAGLPPSSTINISIFNQIESIQNGACYN